MKTPLTYFPVYVGLFATLVLGVACNAYLDIEYGSFGTEVLLWSVVFAVTLWVAWRQQGVESAGGLFWQQSILAVGIAATIFVFMPTWGMPRAGLYLLAALQAAMNCVLVNRRKLMVGLLSSAVMVMFAAVHPRADWTMLFYLVPYLLAVVFTLVSDQVAVRQSPETPMANSFAAQLVAIAAAAAATVLLAFLLYANTPQVNPYQLFWTYGQVSDVAIIKAREQGGNNGKQLSGGLGGGDEESDSPGTGDGDEGQGDQDIANGRADGIPSGPGYRETEPHMPSVAQMREAAKNKSMPRWQSRSIEVIADVTESIQLQVVPLMSLVKEWFNDAKAWAGDNKKSLFMALAAFLALLLLGAACLLARETRLLTLSRVFLDYFRLGVLGWHAKGNQGARQFFYATERLLSLHFVPRDPAHNPREFLANAQRMHKVVHEECAALVELFEKSRYGSSALTLREVEHMREMYRRIYAVL